MFLAGDYSGMVMRRFLLFCILLSVSALAEAANPPQAAPGPPVAGLKVMKAYREKPNPNSVPLLIRAISQQGGLKDPESSGIYVGFLAGILAANPRSAKSLMEQTLPLPFEDQWLVIRAVAYSGLPHWQDLMRDLAARLPDRRVLAEGYLTGKYPTLDKVQLEPPRATAMDKIRRVFKRETYTGGPKEKKRYLTYETSPDLIDVQWGLYFATGSEAAIGQIMMLLPWSKERDNVQRLTMGSMAKLTLALNAAHDVKLLALVKRLAPHQSKEVEPIAKEVIEAAETSDTAPIKKEAMAAIEELRLRGPGSKRDIATWGKVGETAIALGCVGAAVTGQVQLGVPCVVGGALSSAALRYFSAPQ